jgi:hypothetical protein
MSIVVKTLKCGGLSNGNSSKGNNTKSTHTRQHTGEVMPSKKIKVSLRHFFLMKEGYLIFIGKNLHKGENFLVDLCRFLFRINHRHYWIHHNF